MLRMRRNWLKDKVQMVAPIEEAAAGEMEIDDDGEEAADARMEPLSDEPGDVPPPPRPREVRPNAMRPGAEIVRPHNLTHCPYQSWCEVCVASKGRNDTIIVKRHSRWTETLRGSRWISCSLVQKEHSWMNREHERQFSW